MAELNIDDFTWIIKIKIFELLDHLLFAVDNFLKMVCQLSSKLRYCVVLLVGR